jgi:hypothetical protein
MKTFYFNIQSKGGAGKSMLTYLQALKCENLDHTLFVDLDSSTRTSLKQLQFLREKKRLAEVNLTDHVRKIEREKLFEIIESFNEMKFSEFYLDFGAPESQQFPSLFNFDFTAEEFKGFEESIKAKFVFNIVVAGGTSYLSCMEFTKEVVFPLGGKFDVLLYVNEFSFQNQLELIEEIKAFALENKELIKKVKNFGNISVDRNSGQNIINHVKLGIGQAAYKGFATKSIIQREIEKL